MPDRCARATGGAARRVFEGGCALNRATWSPVKGSSASVSTTRSAIVVRQRFFWIPAIDTDIISAQHFWTGGLETAGPGCYDAVGAAGFRMLVMSRIPHAAIVPLTARSRPKERPKHPENRCRTTMAERVGWRSSSANPSGIFRSATDLKYLPSETVRVPCAASHRRSAFSGSRWDDPVGPKMTGFGAPEPFVTGLAKVAIRPEGTRECGRRRPQ